MGKDLTVIVKHTTATNKEKLRGVEGGVGAEEKRNRAKGWGRVVRGGEGDCDQYGSPYERSAAARAAADIASLSIKV